MTDGNFLARLAQLMQIDLDAIGAAYELKPGVMDSMLVLEVIALIDETYGVTLQADALMKCRSVGEILGLIDKAKSA